MKRIIAILIGLTILLSIPYASNLVEATSDATSSNETIQAILDQIENLKTQILALQERLQTMKKSEGEVKEAKEEVKATLRITRQLWRGLSNEDVKLLQEMLATDPDIYPEGLVTGYFGPLTQQAVKRFQKMAGIEQAGRVGPKTMAKINELLEEGAGKSGKVPPGLLVAPGIRKKLGFQPEIPAGQDLPPGICKKLWGGTTTCATGDDEEEPEEPEEPATTTPELACIDSGGTVATSSCCESTSDFPNLCLVGPCGCSPDNSHEINICDCGEGKCFDGDECIDSE